MTNSEKATLGIFGGGKGSSTRTPTYNSAGSSSAPF